jgi:hypothetical protein
MTAVRIPPLGTIPSPGDVRRLWALAVRWRDSWRLRAAGAELEAVLRQIEASRCEGPDVFSVTAYGDSVPELKADALASARSLWGPEADLAMEEIGTVHNTFTREGQIRGQFYAGATVRCLNYEEVSQ